jgi:hypothetical protein
LYARWIDFPVPLLMLRGWWERRHLRNVLLVHFNDLKADLDGEMRRIAAFVGAEIDPRHWSDQVARCTFEAMKRRAPEIGEFERNFVGGGESFLQGDQRRWRAYSMRTSSLVTRRGREVPHRGEAAGSSRQPRQWAQTEATCEALSPPLARVIARPLRPRSESRSRWVTRASRPDRDRRIPAASAGLSATRDGRARARAGASGT